MNVVKIERMGGGFVPFGAPNARIRSDGEKALSELTASEKVTLDALFRNPPPLPSGPVPVPHFRVTRIVGGHSQSVEVPEASVPPSLQSVVQDHLL